MNLRDFNIVFDNPDSTYYAGQQVSGRVLIHTKKEKKIRGINLRFKGEAVVNWTEGKDNTYHAQELYVLFETWLVGSSQGDMILPPGEHVYPFSCRLPMNSPASVEAFYGYVRYTVKVKIDRPWKFNHEVKVAFTVLTPLDLNLEDDMLESTQATKENFLCCWCCRYGPITVVVVNGLKGYVPGQRIQAVIECDNVTRAEVVMTCYLVKTVKFQVHYYGSTNTTLLESVVAVEILGTVGANKSKTWTSNLEVPSLPASYLKYCDCIDISYRFEAQGSIPGPHKNIYVSVPVVIGTIPLRNYFPSIIPSSPRVLVSPGKESSSSCQDAVEANSAPPYEPWVAYPDMPPPSYEECMLAKGNIRNEEDSDYVLGAAEFAPRYPMYNFK